MSYDKKRLADSLKMVYAFTSEGADDPKKCRRFKVLGSSGTRISISTARGTFEGVVEEGRGPTLMITLHHLNHSRSQRILWLLEELGADYEIVAYQRDAKTRLAPPELEDIHPLGKSPVVTDGDLLLHESGAITAYLIRKYGDGKLAPAPGSDDFVKYLEWLHYAEGSAMLPLMLKMYTGRLPDGGADLQPRINDELNRHLGYLNQSLEGVEWFVANTFSGADVQLSFVVELAPLLHTLESFPNLAAFRDRIHARPAYQRALEKGGQYDFGPARTTT